MFKQNRIYRAQVNKLLSISSFSLNQDQAESILDTVYGETTRGFLSPRFTPENLMYGSSQFSHVAADIMSMNLVTPMAQYPQLAGTERLLIPLLIGAPDFWDFMKDKDQKLLEAKDNRESFISMYGHLPQSEFCRDQGITLITGKSAGELSKLLGELFTGTVTKDISILKNKSRPNVYIDSRFLQANWEEAFKLEIFDHAVLSMLDYLSNSNDKERLTLINHNDGRCISKLCGYN